MSSLPTPPTKTETYRGNLEKTAENSTFAMTGISSLPTHYLSTEHAARIAKFGLRWEQTKPTTEQTTKTIINSKYAVLLDNEQVRRWYSGLNRMSAHTAKTRLRRLGLFCAQLQTTPTEFASRNPSTVTDILDDYVGRMDEHGYAPSYVHTSLVALKSWLTHCGVTTTRRIRVRDSDIATTLANEKVPEREELTELMLLGSLKARVIKQLMAKSGIRPGVVGNHDGSDGIRLGDLPDVALSATGGTILKKPARLVVRPSLSKTRKQYVTFLTAAAADTIIAYLEKRALSGETLGPESSLVLPIRSSSAKQFLTSAAVSKQVRDSIRPKFKLRPYALRAYFDTQLLQAEARGLVPESFRVFWMGHTGSIDAVYTTNKRRLPETMLQEMRDAFLRAEQFVDLDLRREDEQEKARRQVQAKVEQLGPETLGRVLKLIEEIGGNTHA